MGKAAERLPNSIAVLPFANISSDPDNDYFCDGISEEILNALGGFRELNVIGRTSSFAFKGSDMGADRISAVLGVGHVLQGSVRRAGNQLRISAQLLDQAGRQVWTQTFDRELANVFSIQSEIAAAVVAKVAPQVVARAESAPRPNLEAYEHYLAGRELLHSRDTAAAIVELQRAIDIDPEFAEAHAEAAIARLVDGPTSEQLDEPRRAIERALALRPKLLRAQAAQGLLHLSSYPPDYAQAERVLRGVVEQDPNMSDALNWLQIALTGQGRDDESFEVLERAARIDPIHPAIAWNLALGYRWQGRLADMNATAKSLALGLPGNHYLLGLSYALLGDDRSAHYWLERSPRDYPQWRWNEYFLVAWSGWQGRYDEALRRFRAALAEHQLDLEGEDRVIQVWYGALLAHNGEYAAAIEHLEPLIELDALVLDPNVVSTPAFDGQHALAWSYLQTGADAKAEALLSALWRKCQDELAAYGNRDSELNHYCAETALLRSDVDQALTLLEQAVDAGWREYYLRLHDTYWSSLDHDPRYRALMVRVKADVDRQRATVQQTEAHERFVARFEAGLAARRAAAPAAGGG